jgi:acylglycerol lipase
MRLGLSKRFGKVSTGFGLALSLAFSFGFTSLANAADNTFQTVSYVENGQLSQSLDIPVYQWSPAKSPKAIIIAAHGLVMHGKSFDKLARTLVTQGYAVAATDMRGYGAYAQEHSHKFCTAEDCKAKIDYQKSYADLVRLGQSLKEQYPGRPMFVVGESLGGSMAIRLAAEHKEMVDGIVLSSPAIKRHTFIDPYSVADCGIVVASPRHQFDLMPFMRHYSSDDPEIVDELINDPLTRKHLSAYELLKSDNAVRKTVSYIPQISPETPVLVIQGSADRCVKANAVVLLLAHLRSVDQTVKWFAERGHILIETSHIKADTMDTVVSWIHTHVDSPALQAKYGPDPLDRKAASLKDFIARGAASETSDDSSSN